MAYTYSDVVALMNEVEYNEAQIATLGARNKDIRTALAAEALGAGWVDARGTQNLELHGVKLKFEFKQNFTLNGGELAKLYNDLSEQDKAAIKYKPELSLTGYKAMSEEGRKRLNVALTSKPGLPVVSFGK